MTNIEFLKSIEGRRLCMLDCAVALLWWHRKADPGTGLNVKQITEALEAAGHPRQNASRLAEALRMDRRTALANSGGAWRLHPRAAADLDAKYGILDQRKIFPRATDSVLPRELFAETRGYLIKVVQQVNASYDAQLFDCCAVMCRRLLETLIIEVYEHRGRAAELKGPDGHYPMLAALLSMVEKDPTVTLGRNGERGLRDFKQLGDLSAHNRRFNARQADVDRVRDGLRVACEELLHLAALI